MASLHSIKLTLLEKVLLLLYTAVILGLFFYSFTQIDLSLTFSRIDILRNTVNTFQRIGYFDRSLSALLFLLLIILLFIFYILFLWLVHKNKIGKTFIWATVITSTVLLVFSYNAFSYDIFNYIFDAKIVTQYHENPYIKKALDYPQDPMLSFMRWTHREYPYGPVWLGLTVPLSFAGMQVFLVTFFLFKVLMAASFIACVYFIGKILQKVSPENELFGLVFFALNPLVLIESVVSAHIDIVMMAFVLWAFYFLLFKKYILAYVLLILSIGIKFVTAFLVPVFLFIHILQKKQKKVRWEFLLGVGVLLLIVGVIAESTRSTFQPWYLLAIFPFAVFLAHKYFILIPSVIISFFSLLNYYPYLATGTWDPPIPQVLSDINFISYSLSFFIVAMYFGYLQIRFARKTKKYSHANEK